MTGIYATARQMLSDLAAKKISARELLDMHVARNDALHGRLNIIVDTDLEHARAAAKSIDDARTHGAQLGALAGLPMTIKDGLDVYGMPAVVGAKGFVGRRKDCNDADVVAAARKAEAIIWGKSNVPYMLSDIQSYNAIYGTTNNPYDVTRVPGGSSGGAAAALASGITPLEIGSDIGGSLRHPANFCGVCSLKPTWGVLSLRGHIPPAPDQFVEGDLGVVGPMARNAEDLRLLWSVLNHSPIQSRGDVKGARIAIWDEEPGWPLAREVKDAVKRAGEALAKQGAHVAHAKPDIGGETMMLSYRAILTAIVSLGFPQEMFETFAAMNDADRKLVADGKDVDGAAANRLRATARFREVAAAQVVQQAMKDKLAAFFQKWDAVLMPISPVTAFKHMQDGDFNSRILDVDGKPVPYPSLLMWISLATFLHAPAIAVPAGRTASGMPVGVQLVGRWRSEDRLFDYAAAIEDVLGGFEPPPL